MNKRFEKAKARTSCGFIKSLPEGYAPGAALAQERVVGQTCVKP